MNSTELISQKLTCLFETGKTDLALDTIENLGDGRGYTCGWAGFTTADEEVVACVEEYTRLVGHNHLERLLPLLRTLQSNGDASTRILDDWGFKTHWKNACSNPPFHAAYARVVDETFGVPAREWCQKLGFELPVAHAVLFDSLIQHGNNADGDGVPAMISATRESVNPRAETDFLWKFLEVRRAILKEPHNRETRDEWRKSTGRVTALEWLLGQNPHLLTPLDFRWEGQNYEVFA